MSGSSIDNGKGRELAALTRNAKVAERPEITFPQHIHFLILSCETELTPDRWRARDNQ